MTEPKFTPGPLHVEGCGGIHMDGSRDGYCVVDATCKMVPYGPYMTKADALLRAASPDLYAACEVALSRMDVWCQSLGEYVAGSPMLAEREQLRLALAKARGES